MIRRTVIGGLLALNVVCAVNLVAEQVSAHPGDAFFEQKWTPDSNVRYKMDNNVPGDWRPAIHDGIARWSDRADGRAPNFIPDGEAAMSEPYSPCAGPNGVFARNMGQDGFPGFAGLTLRCGTTGSSLLQGFTMIYNNQFSWYLGDGTVPNDRWDMRSIATHEAGHIPGFKGHFEDSDICHLDNGNDQTMCEGDPYAKGRSYLRTLEEHDIHTLNNQYPFLTCPPVCRLHH